MGKNRSKVLSHYIFHGDIVGLIDVPQVIDLDDVLMGEEGCQLRLVNKHVDEFRSLDQMGKDPFDGHDLFKTGEAGLLGEKKFGHAARADFIQKEIFPEAGWLIHEAGLYKRGGGAGAQDRTTDQNLPPDQKAVK